MQSKKIQENQLRDLVRREISKVVNERENEVPSKKKSIDQEAPEKEEPKENRGRIIEKITNTYIRMLKTNLDNITPDEMANAIDYLMTQMNYGRDSKVGVIRGLKNKIQS